MSGRWVVVARWHKMDKIDIDAGGEEREREEGGSFNEGTSIDV